MIGYVACPSCDVVLVVGSFDDLGEVRCGVCEHPFACYWDESWDGEEEQCWIDVDPAGPAIEGRTTLEKAS